MLGTCLPYLCGFLGLARDVVRFEKCLALTRRWDGAIHFDGMPATTVRIWATTYRKAHRMIRQSFTLLNCIRAFLIFDDIYDG